MYVYLWAYFKVVVKIAFPLQTLKFLYASNSHQKAVPFHKYWLSTRNLTLKGMSLAAHAFHVTAESNMASSRFFRRDKHMDIKIA